MTVIRETKTGREFVLLGRLLYDKGDIINPPDAYNMLPEEDLTNSKLFGLFHGRSRSFLDLRPSLSTKALSHLRVLSSLLYSSTATSSLDSIGARALEASRMIIDSSSMPLHPQQWKVEAQKIFQISLARIEVNLRGFAEGEGKISIAHMMFSQILQQILVL